MTSHDNKLIKYQLDILHFRFVWLIHVLHLTRGLYYATFRLYGNEQVRWHVR